ncbi:MAG: hypothetical protein AAFN27_05145 [Pseudomonadota bacterium]
MTSKINSPQLLSDDALAEISGGPTYQTPGVYIEGVTTLPATTVPDPMELKRGIDPRD